MAASTTCVVCLHPKAAHGPQEYPAGESGCRATIHVNVLEKRVAVSYSYPCPCKKFVAA